MASNVENWRGERTLKTWSMRRRRGSKYIVSQQFAQEETEVERDDDFSYLFRPGQEWCGMSGGKDGSFVDDEIGMDCAGAGFTMPDSYVVVNLTDLKSKREVRKLKRRLRKELEQVRDVVDQFNGQQSPSPSYNSLGADDQMRVDEVGDEDPVRDFLEVASADVSLYDRGGRMPAKKFKKAVETTKEVDAVLSNGNILLAKNVGNPSARVSQSDHLLQAFKSCKSLVVQLMNHKCGSVFDEPVDADRFNLFDYHTIIKHPMDLGTVKERLATNWYESPMEFAEDVRLTFHNAMTYNPKGHEVHLMAGQLLETFEKKWIVIEEKYKCHLANNVDCDVELAALGSDVDLVAPNSERISHPSSPMRTSGALESSCSETPANSASLGLEMVLQMPEVQINTPSMGMLDGLESSPGETPINSASPFQDVIPEMPDPDHRITPSTGSENAQEFNSSEMPVGCASLVQENAPVLVEAHEDMSYEEKLKLNASIQELPPIKLGGVVEIIKKKNSALFQNEDEVELDINFLDAETLWALKSYVLECNSYSLTTQIKPVNLYQTSAELGCAQLEKGDSAFHQSFEQQSSHNIQHNFDNRSKSINSGNYLYPASSGLDHYRCY